MAISQTDAGLYLLYRDNAMIAPLRKRFDEIPAKPPIVESPDFQQLPAAFTKLVTLSNPARNRP